LEQTKPVSPLWLSLLQFPLTRIILLGGTLFYMMAMNNGFMESFKGDPVLPIAITVGMGLLAMAIYVGYGKLIRSRLHSHHHALFSLYPAQRQRFQGGGTILPRRAAMIIIITPAEVQSTSANTDNSRPKLPAG
jgi:hypothetical protein